MNVDALMAELRSTFHPHPASRKISEELDRLRRRRLAAEAAGSIDEAGCIVVLGPSGSGKTTAVRKAIDDQPLLREGAAERDKPAIFVRVPAPASIKDLAAATLNALGWDIQVPVRWSAMERWRRVHSLSQDFRLRLIHFDEAQHLAGDSARELQATGDALKSRLQDPDWPISLAITATPDFRSVLSQDKQLRRRVIPISIARMSTTSQRSYIRSVLKSYLETSGLQPAEKIKSHDFCRRLMISGDRLFTLTCKMIVDSIEEALRNGSDELDIEHFARAFRRQSGALDAYNPFFAADYESLDVRNLLEGAVDDGDET